MYEPHAYAELAARLKEADPDWDMAGPQPETRVDHVENALGIRFPASFRRFLVEVGRMDFGDHRYLGIDDEYDDSTRGFVAIQELNVDEFDLPDGLLLIEYDHDADILAGLDLTRMQDDECPVVWYDVHRRRIGGDRATSFDGYFRQMVAAWTTPE